MLQWLAVILITSLSIACGGSKSGAPTTPTPAETRIIRLEADLNFGDMPLGSTLERELRIYNSGTGALTVTGVTAPSGYAVSWTGGTVPPGTNQLSIIRFAPTSEQTYNGTLTVNANHTSGSNTMAISGRGIQIGPRTQFGPGQHRVGQDIAAGRYFNDPAAGCYWARLSGFGGTLGEILSNEFIGFNAQQWIVDILPSDRGFETETECGTWFNSPRHGAQTTITGGVWLVGSQLSPGLYRADVRSGCYWERLRGFTGNLNDIIANEFVSTAGPRNIEIRSGDTGFHSDGDCGTWSRTFAATVDLTSGDMSAPNIERNHELARGRYGARLKR
jgi:ASPM-SPD-2-Hydin domain-containing protein